MLPQKGGLAAACAQALGRDWLPRERDEDPDVRRRDRALGLEIRPGLRSLRDIRDGAVQLAYRAVPKDAPGRLALVLVKPPISLPRLRSEWDAFRRLLDARIARRLHLVVLDGARPAVLPEHPELRHAAERLRPALQDVEKPSAPAYPRMPTERFFDLFTFLLARWLRDPSPLSVKALLGGSGASYTSVSQSLRRLEDAGEIRRRPNGDVELPAFPWTTWREVTAVLQPLRGTRAYRDGTGRGLRPASLLPALRKAALPQAAVGGVLAAGRRDPRFDLHGLPRLDLTVHGSRDTSLDELARALHPSLRPCDPNAPEAVLALHPLKRRASLFEPDPKKGWAWADDVETLLDLTELRLLDQVDALIHRRVARERP